MPNWSLVWCIKMSITLVCMVLLPVHSLFESLSLSLSLSLSQTWNGIIPPNQIPLLRTPEAVEMQEISLFQGQIVFQLFEASS